MGEYRGNTIAGFIAYLSARIEQSRREALFQYSITDYAWVLCNIFASVYKTNLKLERFYDRVNNIHRIDTRSGEEIVADVIKKTGLKLV